MSFECNLHPKTHRRRNVQGSQLPGLRPLICSVCSFASRKWSHPGPFEAGNSLRNYVQVFWIFHQWLLWSGNWLQHGPAFRAWVDIWSSQHLVQVLFWIQTVKLMGVCHLRLHLRCRFFPIYWILWHSVKLAFISRSHYPLHLWIFRGYR